MITKTTDLVYTKYAYIDGVLKEIQSGSYDRNFSFTFALDLSNITAYYFNGTRASSQDGYTEHMSGFTCHVPYIARMYETWDITINGKKETFDFTNQKQSLKDNYYLSHKRFLPDIKAYYTNDPNTLLGIAFTDENYLLIEPNRTGAERDITIELSTNAENATPYTQRVFQKTQTCRNVYGAMKDGVFVENAAEWDLRVDKDTISYMGELINITVHGNTDRRKLWEDGFTEWDSGDGDFVTLSPTVYVVDNTGEHEAQRGTPENDVEWYYHVPEDERGGVIRVYAKAEIGGVYFTSPAVEIIQEQNKYTYTWCFGDAIEYTKALAIGGSRIAKTKVAIDMLIWENGRLVERDEYVNECELTYEVPDKNLSDKEKTYSVNCDYQFNDYLISGNVDFIQEAAFNYRTDKISTNFYVEYNGRQYRSEADPIYFDYKAGHEFTVNVGTGTLKYYWRDSQNYTDTYSEDKTTNLGMSGTTFFRYVDGTSVRTYITEKNVADNPENIAFLFPSIGGLEASDFRVKLIQLKQPYTRTYNIVITGSANPATISNGIDESVITATATIEHIKNYDDGTIIPQGASQYPVEDLKAELATSYAELFNNANGQWTLRSKQNNTAIDRYLDVLIYTEYGNPSQRYETRVQVLQRKATVQHVYEIGNVVENSSIPAIAIGDTKNSRIAKVSYYVVDITKTNGIETDRNETYDQIELEYDGFDKNLSELSRTITIDKIVLYKDIYLTKKDVVFEQEAAILTNSSYSCAGFSVDNTSFDGYSKTEQLFTVTTGAGWYNTSWKDSKNYTANKAENKTVTIGSNNVFWSLKSGTTYKVDTNPIINGTSTARSGYVYPIVDGNRLTDNKVTISQNAQGHKNSYELIYTIDYSPKPLTSNTNSVTVTARATIYTTKIWDDNTTSRDNGQQHVGEIIANNGNSTVTSLSGRYDSWILTIPTNNTTNIAYYYVYFETEYNGATYYDRIEIPQPAKTYNAPVITSASAIIPAKGGTVNSITVNYEYIDSNGKKYTDSIIKTIDSVTANSLGTTVTNQTQIASRSITVTANGKTSAAFTAIIYQEANAITSYGSVSAPTITQKANLPASGITLSTSNIGTYVTVGTSSQTITYTSGATRAGSISYGWSGNNTTVAGLGTTVKSISSVSINTLTYTAKGEGSKSNSATVSALNQAANNTTTITYGDITISSVTCSDVPAGGGSITSGSVSYSQPREQYYTSGSHKAISALTSGGTVTWSGGASNIASLGTTVKSRTSTGKTLSVTVTMNGKSASSSCTVYQAANAVTSWGTVSAPTLSQKTQVSAAGATISTTTIANYLTIGGSSQTISYTSGSTRAGTITYAWSGSSTTIASLKTTVKSATSVAINTLTYTATGEGSKTNKATISALTQAANAKTTITYGDISITSLSCSDVPAGGGSVTSGSVSYSQPRTQNYTSGSTEAMTALTSGATLTWSGGVSNAGSLGATVQGRTSTGVYLTVKVAMNSKSASSSVLVYRAANARTVNRYAVEKYYAELEKTTIEYTAYGLKVNQYWDHQIYQEYTSGYKYTGPLVSKDTYTGATTVYFNINGTNYQSNTDIIDYHTSGYYIVNIPANSSTYQRSITVYWKYPGSTNYQSLSFTQKGKPEGFTFTSTNKVVSVTNNYTSSRDIRIQVCNTTMEMDNGPYLYDTYAMEIKAGETLTFSLTSYSGCYAVLKTDQYGSWSTVTSIIIK